MKKDNPRFRQSGYVWCCDCPFENESKVCLVFEEDVECPSRDTYKSACLMAEEAAKGGKE